MTAKKARIIVAQSAPIYERIREILESARTTVARSVNTTQVVANWLIGREIFEEEQRGQERADYGDVLIPDLATRLTQDFGSGYLISNLKNMRQFYRAYPQLVAGDPIGHAVRGQSGLRLKTPIGHAVRGQSQKPAKGPVTPARIGRNVSEIAATNHLSELQDQSWQPGQLHPNLSWTHYRTLLRVDRLEARSFYEIESLNNSWSTRELERQINSLLFERLAKSRDKRGVRRLATKGQEIATPADIFKDPIVIEFLGLPESPRLVESDLETALLNQLQAFLLELGKGFAFVERQARITLEGDHFYVDLVFYHVVLKCYVIIDLKVGKLTHADLGQLQLYVNYFDEKRCSKGDNPTLGLILCTDKNDAVVKYTLGDEQSRKIFASRYKLHLPTEDQLLRELRREVRLFPTASDSKMMRKKPRKQ